MIKKNEILKVVMEEQIFCLFLPNVYGILLVIYICIFFSMLNRSMDDPSSKADLQDICQSADLCLIAPFKEDRRSRGSLCMLSLILDSVVGKLYL